MNEAWVAGLFGFLGILAGGLLQFWMARHTSREAKYMESKLNAYVDYINSVGKVAFAADSERGKALEQVATAKTRMCVFGDKEVMEVAAEFERSSRDLSNADAQSAFIALVQVMRAHGVAVGGVADVELHTLLFQRKAGG